MKKDVLIQRASTLFLQAVLILIGIGTLAFLLWEPLVEGRNAQATLFEVYFNDLFLAYAYTGSIAFFVALYKAFRVLGYIRHNQTFSQTTVKAVRAIQYCALTLIGFIVPAVAYLMIVRPGDDIAGGVFMGVLITFGSLIIAAAAAVFEGLLQSAGSTPEKL